MNRKGKKIKHYKGSFDTGKFRRRRIFRWILLLVVLFGASYFLAPPILDMGAHVWYSVLKNESPSTDTPEVSATPDPEATPSPTPEPTPEPEPQGDWSVVSIESVANGEIAQQTAQQLAAQGVKYAVIPLKTGDGVVHYASTVPLAAGSLSATPFDAAAAAFAFQQAGIIPVAEIWAYQDPIAPYTDRTIAVEYGSSGQGMLWLDNSVAAGGKPWLNPYSAGAQQYVKDLALEAVSLGYKQVIFRGLQFPQVKSLAGAAFGDTAGKSFDAVLNETIQQLQSALSEKGAKCWFQYSAAAVTGEDLIPAGVPVGSLSMERLLIELPSEMPDPSLVFSSVASASGEKFKGLRFATAPDETLRQLAEQNGFSQLVIG